MSKSIDKSSEKKSITSKRQVKIQGKSYTVNIIHTDDQTPFISENDAEMDYRGREAIRAAIHKAEVCKKPIAKYDSQKKQSYIEYPDGRRKYASRG